MILRKVVERRLSGAPTGIYLTQDRIYLSVKKRYVIEAGYSCLKLRKIITDQSIRTMTGNEDELLCFSEKGVLYSMYVEEDRIKKEVKFGAGVVNAAVYDRTNGSAIVGTEKGKIIVCGRGFEPNRILYGSSPGIIGLAMSALGSIACVYEINQTVTVFGPKSLKGKDMRIPDGYPQAVVFVDDTRMAVGTHSGELYLIDSEGAVISSLSLSDPITTLFMDRRYLFVGTENGKMCSVSVDDKMEIKETYQCNGMVNAICSSGDNVVVGVGKEPRLGRWITKKDGEHKLIVFKLEQGI